MDGIDAALLWTDGEGVIEPRGFHSTAYSSPFRQALAECLQAPDRLAPSLEEELTRRHADAVQELLSRFGVTVADIALVGFHGHTVLHRPAERRTWQLGDGGQLAAATGIPVVFDFRSADVAAGGHGAPLAPIFHAGIAASVERPCVFLNLGGIANVTWVGGGADELIAFDTGPANMLLDQWVARHTGEAMDFGGKLALEGKADPKVLAGMMGNRFSRNCRRSRWTGWISIWRTSQAFRRKTGLQPWRRSPSPVSLLHSGTSRRRHLSLIHI